MLNKKAIAAFAAAATLVSGLAIATPALADKPVTNGESEVKELNVTFKFTKGDDSVTSRSFKVYCKDGKYGLSKDDIKYGADSIAYSVFNEAKANNNKFASVKGFAFPTTINAGENTVQVSDNAASNDEEHSEEDLQKQAQKQLDDANKISELAQKAEKEGLTFAAKQIRKAKTVEGAQTLLAEAEKAAIETLAQKAEKEGFTFVAKYIRKAKTVEGARALLAEAEKNKKQKPTPVPPAPVPSQPSGNGTGNGTGTGTGTGAAAGNTNNNKTTKNAASTSAPLAKTGAAVALMAVAASVLAGMGAALRKIRH
ncbi:hypothetical protein ACMZ8B_02890 [Gardnerella greenwoodii]|uniref:hypothetical protein n=1 Tax=Gardnerella greenwoodii TaxID=2914925 RepID=UPI0039F03C70